MKPNTVAKSGETASNSTKQKPKRKKREHLPGTEKYLQREVLEFLKNLGIPHWRQNSGNAFLANGSMLKMGVKGLPDVICIIPGGFILGLELKGTKGVVSESQLVMQQLWRDYGAAYKVVRSMAEVIRFLEKSTIDCSRLLNPGCFNGTLILNELNRLENALHEASNLLQQTEEGAVKWMTNT